MLNRLAKRRRRAVKARIIIRKSGRARICVYRSLKHFYAQLIVPGEKGDRVLASASSLDKEIKAAGFSSNNVELASKVGEILAQRIIALHIEQVALDRAGNKYHRRLRAFKESAEKVGLIFKNLQKRAD
jgi:large subunit ribosomal protein L18